MRPLLCLLCLIITPFLYWLLDILLLLLAESCQLRTAPPALKIGIILKYLRQLLLPEYRPSVFRCPCYLILSCAWLGSIWCYEGEIGPTHWQQTTASLPHHRKILYHIPQRKARPDKRTDRYYDHFTFISYHRHHWSLLDRLFFDAVGLGIPFPAIFSFFMVRFPSDAATLLSRYPGIVPDLRTKLLEHRLLRPGLYCLV